LEARGDALCCQRMLAFLCIIDVSLSAATDRRDIDRLWINQSMMQQRKRIGVQE